MSRFVLRVDLPDRPGALGAVTSRIGAVRADVVGFEIVERGPGRAVDDIAIEIDDEHVELLLTEIAQVDGVAVMEINRSADELIDPRLDALETAAEVTSASSVHAVLVALCEHAARTIGASWVAVVDADEPDPSGDAKAATDTLRIPIESAGQVLVLGREGERFRERERRSAELLARIADNRCRLLVT